jgi:hypothetical protein
LTKLSTYLHKIGDNRKPRQNIWICQYIKTKFNLLYTTIAALKVFGNFKVGAYHNYYISMQDIL